MLTNIRNALISETNQPFPNLESVEHAYAIPDEPLDILFAEEFLKVSGEFVFCEREEDCINSLNDLIITKKFKTVICNEPALIKLFQRHSFINYKTSKIVTQATVGITMCEALIARTGSILISSRQAMGRTLPIYPPYNIVIASTQQLVLDINEGLTTIRNKYNHNMPSMVCLTTGPSRTADIEKTLVLGAHGPKAVYVFLIDNWAIDEPAQ